ncbi:hypothetical protein GYH30_003610 [Glycine max]|uniref:Uncharacterized protein n=1 Tax=Glycine max TaxID=3847 RepID=K7K7J6_SOYBN|nr:hypothetical protein GYH30_003610 [Glycine max]
MELLKKHFQKFISSLMSLPIKLPITKLYQSLQAKNKIILGKRNNGIYKVPEDVVDVFLSDASEKLTDDLIVDNIIDMMIPGEDLVPLLMTLATKYLLDCAIALQQLTGNLKLKKLQDQHGESLSWTDYLSLPFTQTVISETLRMGNIIIGVMRKALKDVEIKRALNTKRVVCVCKF